MYGNKCELCKMDFATCFTKGVNVWYYLGPSLNRLIHQGRKDYIWGRIDVICLQVDEQTFLYVTSKLPCSVTSLIETAKSYRYTPERDKFVRVVLGYHVKLLLYFSVLE